MKYDVRYKRPRSFDREIVTEKDTNKHRRTTIITEDTLLQVLYIPIAPTIHPEGQFIIAKKAGASAFVVANILATQLHARKQHNIVTISLEDICKLSHLGRTTVINSLDRLEQIEMIAKIKRQSYKLSPELAWFGNEVDWAIALKEAEIKRQEAQKANLTQPST